MPWPLQLAADIIAAGGEPLRAAIVCALALVWLVSVGCLAYGYLDDLAREVENAALDRARDDLYTRYAPPYQPPAEPPPPRRPRRRRPRRVKRES